MSDSNMPGAVPGGTGNDEEMLDDDMGATEVGGDSAFDTEVGPAGGIQTPETTGPMREGSPLGGAADESDTELPDEGDELAGTAEDGSGSIPPEDAR